MKRRIRLTCLLLIFVLLVPHVSAAQTSFSRIFVFGDSLSDPGNAFALTGWVNTPPYEYDNPQAIPDKPYAVGGHHFSNGATWVEQLARSFAMAGNTKPALGDPEPEAGNYAVGGAGAYNRLSYFNLTEQVDAFLKRRDGAPADGLYVVQFGANDIRDAMTGDVEAIFQGSFSAIAGNIQKLYAAGARKFLVPNAPNLARTPAVMDYGTAAVAGAAVLTGMYNTQLEAVLAALAPLPGIEIVRLDFFNKVNEMVDNPENFGFTVVNAPCVTPGVAPFSCHDADDYLFWDGIHPTRAGHGIVAQMAADMLRK
jgi:phospholipase/lecithinase/hemolysin